MIGPVLRALNVVWFCGALLMTHMFATSTPRDWWGVGLSILFAVLFAWCALDKTGD